MKENKRDPPDWGKVSVLAYLTAVVVALASAGGIFLPGTYARETPSWAAQGLGQDVVNLVLVAPMLALSAYLAPRGRRFFGFVLAGLLVYCVYSYLLYGLCVHYNRLFFIYCAALGLPVYALILWSLRMQRERPEDWFDRKRSTLLPALTLLFLTVVFYLAWLSEDLPALHQDSPPPSVQEAGLFTNPVHFLDYSLMLPAMLVAALGLLRRKAFGYVSYPVLQVFSIAMLTAIGGMMAVLTLKGMGGNGVLASAFGVLALLNGGVLVYFSKCVKRKNFSIG